MPLRRAIRRGRSLGIAAMGKRRWAYAFNPANMPDVELVRTEIQEQIARVLSTNSHEIGAVATEAMEAIRQLRHIANANRGIEPAAATRWLALARPDCLVSVNGASARRLGEPSGLPLEAARLADAYSDLIAWVHNRPWFNEFNGQQPVDPLEPDIWNCRAALVDVLSMMHDLSCDTGVARRRPGTRIGKRAECPGESRIALCGTRYVLTSNA